MDIHSRTKLFEKNSNQHKIDLRPFSSLEAWYRRKEEYDEGEYLLSNSNLLHPYWSSNPGPRPEDGVRTWHQETLILDIRLENIK